MPEKKQLAVSAISLDLNNYRTIHQDNEINAINTMISIGEKRFYSLIESIITDGYLPTENIIILEENKNHIVKEGNRRIAALKIILNEIEGIELPADIQSKIDSRNPEWDKANKTVPCNVYSISEKNEVDRIISLIHAKGEKAGRDKWTAVATARHNRDEKGESEPGLDLLEKYLRNGRNITPEQKERWSGDYPLTVLNEALQKISKHLNGKTVLEVVRLYPKKDKRILDTLVYDIGIQKTIFKTVRNKESFLKKYGIKTEEFDPSGAEPSGEKPAGSSSSGNGGASGSSSGNPKPDNNTGPKSLPLTDPRSVARALRTIVPKGTGKEKIVTVRDEMLKVQIASTPLAFCFLLRCIFELSAKAYCRDNKSSGGPSSTTNKGVDKTLKNLLRDITNHITNNKSDKEKVKILHGAMSELATDEGLLSVTSMNHLVHHPSFSVSSGDICTLFHRVFPLLEEMNK